MRTKRRLALLIPFLVILLIILVVTASGHVVSTVRALDRQKAPNGLLTTKQDKKAEKYLKTLKNKKSDIKGMTQYDKYKKGLVPNDGSDTDGDGLTDKEEIEKYHTDPLKMSTSGDVITDGEKVKEGLDLGKKYNAKIANYPYNSCKEVKLNGTTAESRAAIVEKPYFRKLEGVKTYQEYQIQSFVGDVTIDLKDLLKKNNVKTDNIAVYVQDGSGKARKVKDVEFNGSRVTISDTFTDDKSYYDVFIARKAFLANAAKVMDSDAEDRSLSGAVNATMGKSSYNAVIANKDDMDGIAYGAPIFHFLTGQINVLYYDTGDKTKNAYEKEALVKRANSVDEAQMTVESKSIKKASKAKIESLYKLFSTILPNCNGKYYGDNYEGAWDLLFYYERFSSADKTLRKSDNEAYKDMNAKNVYSGFTFGKDQFAFPNFSAEASGGGVCAGISTYTAKVYNSKKVNAPLYGTVTDEAKNKYAWDIRGKEFDKLRTRGKLYTYEKSDYVKKHTDSHGYMTKNMTKKDSSFVGMLLWYFAKANQIDSSKTYIPAQTGRAVGAYDYKWDSIEYIKNKINKGQIVSLAMIQGNDKSKTIKEDSTNGHEINIVDYAERTKNDIKFHVYDCNYPNRDDLYLYVKKRYDSFDFLYQPDPDNNEYVFTNEKIGGMYSFEITDENDFSCKSVLGINRTGWAERDGKKGTEWSKIKFKDSYLTPEGLKHFGLD